MSRPVIVTCPITGGGDNTEKAVHLLDSLGGEPATANQAREILGLTEHAAA